MVARMQSEFAHYWRRIRARTMTVAGCIPRDRVEWSPGSGEMAIGDMVRHLAVTERWLFVEVARGGRSAYLSHGPELGRSLEEVLGLLKRLHDESLGIIEQLAIEEWHRPVCTPGGTTMPAWKWLRAMVEHEVHHRGQLYLMLRLCGVATPPIFGLTSEQVRQKVGNVS
jgi:uncharacterized damage-inducible protein DinB